MAKKSEAEMSKQKERTKTTDKKSKAELTERLVSFAKTAKTAETAEKKRFSLLTNGRRFSLRLNRGKSK